MRKRGRNENEKERVWGNEIGRERGNEKKSRYILKREPMNTYKEWKTAVIKWDREKRKKKNKWNKRGER